MKIRIAVPALTLVVLVGCAPAPMFPGRISGHINPAEEFSRASAQGNAEDFSIYKVAEQQRYGMQAPEASPFPSDSPLYGATLHRVDGNPDLLGKGWDYQGSLAAPKQLEEAPTPPSMGPQKSRPQPPMANFPPPPPGPPPGSSSPYYRGQMTANPSLWPDNGGTASLFTDFRAYQAMDVITVVISESSVGKKKAETDAKSEFDLLAGITEFFGVETAEWAANNTSLDPTALIQANTDIELKGEGETEREGSMTGTISAVIMEVLPNGLLRIEGTKIISVNDEEEVMVISGLVRQRDVSSENRVQSGRIANMRIDFYGRGIVNDQQNYGWGAWIFKKIWPF
ncbi:MAG: flagellar basal body L-ring protein FlgH [Bdellovibrionales bacterium]|nr:flagellar basal body L-ring protein FlgH [Bdellovibrionales bacterium]